MTASSRTPPSPQAFRVSALSAAQPAAFVLEPDAEARAALAEEMGLSAIRKLRFAGELRATGNRDWVLEGTLGATIVQPCAVTLAPVTTRIDEPVSRRYLRDWVETEDPEAEMPEDDTTEPLGAWIDPRAVMIEALSLALPLYPRAEGVSLGEAVYAEPGTAPMTDEQARPFAGLAALRDGMKDDD